MSSMTADLPPITSSPPQSRSPNASLHVRRSTELGTSPPNSHSSRILTQPVKSFESNAGWQSPPQSRRIPSMSPTMASPRSGRMSIGSLLTSSDVSSRPQTSFNSHRLGNVRADTENPDVNHGRVNGSHGDAAATYGNTGGRARANSYHQGSSNLRPQDSDPSYSTELLNRSRRDQRKSEAPRDIGFATPGAPSRHPASSAGNKSVGHMLPPRERERDRDRGNPDQGQFEAESTSPRFLRHTSVPAHPLPYSGYQVGGLYSPAGEFNYGPSSTSSVAGPPAPWARTSYPVSSTYLGANPAASPSSSSSSFMPGNRYASEQPSSYNPEQDPYPVYSGDGVGRKRNSPEEYMHRRNDHQILSNGGLTSYPTTEAKPHSGYGNTGNLHNNVGDRDYGSQVTGPIYANDHGPPPQSFGSNGYDAYDRYPDSKLPTMSRGPPSSDYGELKQRERVHSTGEKLSRDGMYSNPSGTVNGSRRKASSHAGRNGGSEKNKSASTGVGRVKPPSPRVRASNQERPLKSDGIPMQFSYETIPEESPAFGPETVALRPVLPMPMHMSTGDSSPEIGRQPGPMYPPQGNDFGKYPTLDEKQSTGTAASTYGKGRPESFDLGRMHKFGKTRVDNSVVDAAIREACLRTVPVDLATGTSESETTKLEVVEEQLGEYLYTSSLRLPFLSAKDVGRSLTVQIPATYLSKETDVLASRKLWGSGVYTDDSDILAMLYHQGLVKTSSEEDESGILEASNVKQKRSVRKGVKVYLRVAPKLTRYAGSELNGLTSRDWGRNHDGQSLVVERVETIWNEAISINARRTLKSRMTAFLRERRAVFEGGCARDPYYRLMAQT